MVIEIVVGLIQNAYSRSQIFITTQSPGFVEMFGPQEIVVVERCRRESTYRRLDEERLGEWLEEYTLAELWNKNVLGGRPMG